MRETVQRQADGASKAERRIQPVVRAVGRDGRSQDSAWLIGTAAGALSALVRHRR